VIVGRARGADVNILLIGEGGIRRATSFADLCFIGAGGVRFALQLRITLYELQIKIELTKVLINASGQTGIYYDDADVRPKGIHKLLCRINEATT
jgi:hypothetical protein